MHATNSPYQHFSTLALDLKKIRLDGGTQARAKIYGDTVADYVALIGDGVVMDAGVVYFDGSSYWLAEGFHRYHAHCRAGLTQMRVEVRKGSRERAVVHAARANAKHGRPRSQEDKRRSIEMLIALPDYKHASDRAVGEICDVSHPTVAAVRREQREREQEATRAGGRRRPRRRR